MLCYVAEKKTYCFSVTAVPSGGYMHSIVMTSYPEVYVHFKDNIIVDINTMRRFN